MACGINFLSANLRERFLHHWITHNSDHRADEVIRFFEHTLYPAINLDDRPSPFPQNLPSQA